MKVGILGVPLDLGASKRGAADGPRAIRAAGLVEAIEDLGHEVEDHGDLALEFGESPRVGSSKKRYHKQILEACEKLAARSFAISKDALPLALGGDHSLAMGSVAGAAKRHAEDGKRIGLLWVDAHGDMNTPATSSSGNVHGMPLAHLLGLGDRKLASVGGIKPKVLPKNVVLLGVRDLDEGEKRLMRETGINVLTMSDVDRHGVGRVTDTALQHLTDETAGFHVSFDVDAIDPAIAQGTGTMSRGGLTYREAHLLMEIVAASKFLTSLDMVEVNPLLDVKSSTAKLAVELVASALGRRIF